MFNPFDDLYKWLEQQTGSYVVPLIGTGALIILCTMLLTWVITKGLRKYLTRGKTPLPSMSIYINLARFSCWVLGISILLSTCFGVNVTGLIAALGVGGIAISLGFKDTISNLISGVQVSTMKIMEPGDHVMVSNLTGTVKDTTWRHTTIENMDGETIIVPNSIINATAIVKKKSFQNIRVHITLHSKSKALSDATNEIAELVENAVEKHGEIDGKVIILFSSVADQGAKGSITVKMKKEIDGAKAAEIKNTIVKAIAPYVENAKE